MAHNIVKNKRFLQSLKRASGSLRKNLIKKATDPQIRSVQELALNLLKKRIPLKKHVIVTLRPHKKALKSLASKKGSINSKRKLLEQKGGAFLTPLLTTALSFLANELRSI